MKFLRLLLATSPASFDCFWGTQKGSSQRELSPLVNQNGLGPVILASIYGQKGAIYTHYKTWFERCVKPLFCLVAWCLIWHWEIVRCVIICIFKREWSQHYFWYSMAWTVWVLYYQNPNRTVLPERNTQLVWKNNKLPHQTVCSSPTQRSASKWSTQTWPMCLIRRRRELITQRSFHMGVNVSSWMVDPWPRPAMVTQSTQSTRHVNSTASVRHVRKWTMAPVATLKVSIGCIASIWTFRSLIVLIQVRFPRCFYDTKLLSKSKIVPVTCANAIVSLRWRWWTRTNFTMIATVIHILTKGENNWSLRCLTPL